MIIIDRSWLAPSHSVNEISMDLEPTQSGGGKGDRNDFVLMKTILYQYALEQLQNCLTARSIPKIDR
jgi:hypothetical protein